MQTEVLEKKYNKELKIIAEHTAIADDLKKRIDEAKHLEISEVIKALKLSVPETNELIRFLRRDRETVIKMICDSEINKGGEMDESKDM